MNGEFIQTSTLSGVAATTSTGSFPRIGCTDAPGRCFNGAIDEVIIFNKALTSSQVNALYNLDLSSV